METNGANTRNDWRRRELHPLTRVSSGRLYIRGGPEIAPLDRFKAQLARARCEALVAARREETLRAAGGDEVIAIEEAARILGFAITSTRALFRRGDVPGAYREGKRWWIKKRHLWKYLHLRPGEVLMRAG